MSDTRAAAGRVAVNPGDEIVSSWGNLTFDQSVNVFASTADRDSQWPTAPDGACCYTIAETTMWQYRSGGWAAIVGPGQAPPTTGGIVTALDGNGEAWAAAPTVGAGKWAKARDVLSFHVGKQNAQSVGASSFVKIAFDLKFSDSYGLFNVAGASFTCPLAGRWRADVRCDYAIAAATVRTIAAVYVNGAEARRGSDVWYPNASTAPGTVNVEILLAAGDVVDYRHWATVAGTVGADTVGNLTHFTMSYTATN